MYQIYCQMMQFWKSDIDDISRFNQDLEIDIPRKVKEFKSKISKVDAILNATPEYDYSVPGVLKNAIDGLQDYIEIIQLMTSKQQS